MVWKDITQYLDRFKNITPPERFLKEAVAEAIEATCGISLTSDEINIKNNNIFLNIDSVEKNEIFLKKYAVLDYIKNKAHVKTITDIR